MMGEYYRGFKFYAGNSAQQMASALPKLQTISKDIVPTNVNEIVELYNIFLCFQEFQGMPNVSEDDKSIYRTPCQIIPQLCGRFCSTITDDNIISYFRKIIVNYKDELISLLEEYKVFERISGPVFIKLIEEKIVSLSRFLSHKFIVKRYDSDLVKHIRDNAQTAEIIISHLWGDTSSAKVLPQSLSNEQICQLIDSYIDLEDDKIHPNYLQLIENAFDTNGLRFTDELKLKAKRRRVRYWENQSSDLHLFQYGYEIAYTTDLPANDPVRIEQVDKVVRFTYSQNWFDENLDSPTILNNFIWIFGFVDYQYRCTFSPSASKMSTMEAFLGMHGKRYYPASMQCRLEQGIAHANLATYYHKLLRSSIRLEDVLEWFFKDYATNEFGIENYHFEAPSAHTSILEKCKLIALSIDEILKQFTLWAKHGVIDRALLEISSKPLEFNAIKSKQLRKYAYVQSNDIKREMALLFSDTFPISKCDQGKTFDKLLNNRAVQESDFEDYEKENLEFLASRGSVVRDGNILSSDRHRIALLKDLYTKEVLCPSYLQSYEQLLAQLEAAGDIVCESTLFSRPEQQFLNQKLNKAEFVNGDDLRNKYVHGCYPLDEKKQERDYFELLVIFVLIIIKINEEFLLGDENIQED